MKKLQIGLLVRNNFVMVILNENMSISHILTNDTIGSKGIMQTAFQSQNQLIVPGSVSLCCNSLSRVASLALCLPESDDRGVKSLIQFLVCPHAHAWGVCRSGIQQTRTSYHFKLTSSFQLNSFTFQNYQAVFKCISA